MRSDIAFSSDDSHRFLPWLIGMMVTLAALLLCYVVTINGWVVERHGNYANNFTVNIPVVDAEKPPSEEMIAAVIESLQKTKGVTTVNRLSNNTLQNMLVPWLGTSAVTSQLPLPVVIDVALAKGASINHRSLQESLSSFAPAVEVDAHETWVKAFLEFSFAVRSMLVVLSIIIIAAIILMIAFTSRASLHLHGKSVRLLHSIGAEDQYIAKQFQQEACFVTLRGALAGCAFAAASFWGIGFYLNSLENASIPSFDLSLPHIILLIATPVACAALAWVTARFSVLAQLRQML
jgi:cell division transport system permease protein